MILTIQPTVWNGIDRRKGHPSLADLRILTDSLLDRDNQIKQDLNKFKTIADELPVGVWYCDADGNASYVNKTWCKWAGVVDYECLGHGWLESIVAEDKLRTAKQWAKSVLDGKDYKAFYRIINKYTGSEKKCFALGKKINSQHWVGLTIDLDEIGGTFYESRE